MLKKYDCSTKNTIQIPSAVHSVVATGLIVSVLLGIVTTLPFLSFKKNKTKSDYLIIYNKLFTILFTFYISFFLFIDTIGFPGQKIPEATFITVFFLSNTFLKMAISYEEYSSMNDPFTTIRRYINKSSSIIYEIVFIFVLGLFFFIHYISLINEKLDGFDRIICIIDANFLYVNSLPLYCLMSIFILVHFVIWGKKIITAKTLSGARPLRKRLKIEFVEILLSLFFLVYMLAILFIIDEVTSDSNPFQFKQKYEIYFYVYIITFEAFLLLENLWTAMKTFHSDFFTSVLCHTVYAKLYKMFGKAKASQNIVDFSSENTSLISQDSHSIRKRFLFEGYVVKTFDINVSLIYMTMYMMFGKAESNAISTNDTMMNPTIGKASKHVYERYVFEKNHLRNDFIDEKNKNLFNFIEGYTHSYLKVEVKSFFPSDFRSILKERGIDVKLLKSTFLNQFMNVRPHNGSNDRNRQNYISVLGKYLRADTIRQQPQLLLKTMDKHYHIEILPNNFFSGENLKFLKNYIKRSRNSMNSFLPVLIGAFSLKINNLGEICFLVTKNRIKELKKQYNSWYMFKLSYELKFSLMTSSKDRVSNLVNEDEKFLTSHKDKIQLSSYNVFKSSIDEDCQFLQQSKRTGFNLLMLYYEMGSNNLNAGSFSMEEKDKNTFRVSNFSPNDISVIPGDMTKKDPFADSSVKDFGNYADLSKYGYEANFRNFKCFNYFMFDNVFQERAACPRGSFYQNFKQFVLQKFDEISIN